MAHRKACAQCNAGVKPPHRITKARSHRRTLRALALLPQAGSLHGQYWGLRGTSIIAPGREGRQLGRRHTKARRHGLRNLWALALLLERVALDSSILLRVLRLSRPVVKGVNYLRRREARPHPNR